MFGISGLRRIFRFPWRTGRQIEHEVDTELRFHLDRRTEELVEQGMTPEAARREAVRQFGDLAYTRQYCRALDGRTEQKVRRTMLLDGLWQDVLYGLRMLIRTPGLSAVAVLTILVNLSEDIPSQDRRGNRIPILDLIDWREQQTAFRGLGAFTMGTINLADDDSRPERFQGAFVSASVFAQVDGVPILGRVFNPEEDAGTGEQVVILGHSVWQGRYGADPNIIGKSIRANAEAATVVGVMPQGFHFPLEQDIWLPLNIDPQQAERGASRVGVVGRLREGVSIEQADVQMQQIARRIAEAYPETNEGVGVWVQSYTDRMARGTGGACLAPRDAFVPDTPSGVPKSKWPVEA